MRSIPTAAPSIDVIVRDLKTNCERDFGDARAMPPGVYTSPEFLEREQQTLFRNEWLCMGRASALPNPGDYLTAEIAGQPIIVIRRDDGTLRAMSNVCLHRMSTLLEGRGNVRRIVCPYHAWNYSLDGDLRGAPMMDRQDGFCKDSYKLPQVRCEIWQGWVYVTLNEEASPVAARLKELDELIVNYDMASYVETFHEEHVWDTNWKILAENFMESYHLPMLHRATVGPHSRLDEMECPPGLPAFNYHWITKEASLPIGNAHPDNTRLQGQWRKTTALLAIYPTHLVTLTPGYFWYLVLQPLGVDRVHIRFGGGLSPEFIDDPKAAEYMATLKKLLDEVNLEDRRGVEAVFRGVHAPLAKPGHLSHLERPNYDFARYLASHVAV
ncbi:Rieske 2Fe-2S domain-containing protein [Burkholderia cenocepacia]|uniref:Rieske 2Fe-2S domain-containing protein n=1 Tax=Burkholderia orbicola TaxID=2978683 RepID=A0ABT8NRW6_9BURK|nr:MULTISPECIES: SRPBCC family protein [Burkholderia]MBK1820730.1 Rieske 2Fe-2S domain-containing protein [Burkholderia orbicola]MBR8090352.1 Rieske 2Fe-2S domain-containing protein [Burkholderia cenocepacia]MBR8295469.1 Rieske 2Fe-2S domain-containing protein [Burkholderia cenocepacia]MBR8322665.1 Rieske 2Fe-2S domain-containing protein [Burkholderia cenocepacia]MBR8378474.1 Rieske 2Fe-2S domain-containing protein [Burkholderia cenocepacia]